jgi:hypothetical protein
MKDTIGQLPTTDAHYDIVKDISDLPLPNAQRRTLKKHINTYCSDVLAGNTLLIKCITDLGYHFKTEPRETSIASWWKRIHRVKLDYGKQRDAMCRAKQEMAPLDMCLALCMAFEPRLGEHSHVKVLDPEVVRMVCAFAGLRTASYLGGMPKMLD